MATVLKVGPRRTVTLEEADGARVVVKRFHAGGLARLRDGARARREHRALAAARAAGLPAVEPLGVRRRAGRWELCTRHVAGGPVAPLLGGEASWPVPRERALARLGRLLAAVHAAGLRHPDLHPKNVLLDGEGHPWLVDLGGARFVSRASPERRIADLVALAALAHERLAARPRLRFLAAYLRALPTAERVLLGPAPALARRIEGDACERRRAEVLRHLDRWLRPSSRCVELDGRRLRGVVRRDLATVGTPELEAWLGALLAVPGEPDGPHRRVRHPDPAGAPRAWLVRRAPRRADLEAEWLAAARGHEHARPGPTPAALVEGAAVFQV